MSDSKGLLDMWAGVIPAQEAEAEVSQWAEAVGPSLSDYPCRSSAPPRPAILVMIGETDWHHQLWDFHLSYSQALDPFHTMTRVKISGKFPKDAEADEKHNMHETSVKYI